MHKQGQKAFCPASEASPMVQWHKSGLRVFSWTPQICGSIERRTSAQLCLPSFVAAQLSQFWQYLWKLQPSLCELLTMWLEDVYKQGETNSMGWSTHWNKRYVSPTCLFFPKQFTVGVLNATWDLAALVLVGVVGFLGSEVVLSPVVSHCLRLSPFMWGVGVGWCGRLLGLWSGLVSRCLRLSPFMWGAGWLVWPHLEQKYSEIKITGFNLNWFTVNCLGSTLV